MVQTGSSSLIDLSLTKRSISSIRSPISLSRWATDRFMISFCCSGQLVDGVSERNDGLATSSSGIFDLHPVNKTTMSKVLIRKRIRIPKAEFAAKTQADIALSYFYIVIVPTFLPVHFP